MSVNKKSLYYLLRRDAEKKIIAEALSETAYNISRAAKNLGIDKSNFRRKLRSLGFPAYPRKSLPEQGTCRDSKDG